MSVRKLTTYDDMHVSANADSNEHMHILRGQIDSYALSQAHGLVAVGRSCMSCQCLNKWAKLND